MVALVGLRHGACAATLRADDNLRYLARSIRERFPDVEIIVRADSAFGVPLMYDVCEELRLTHTFGLAMNPCLKAASADLLAQAKQQFEATGVNQRLFLPLSIRPTRRISRGKSSSGASPMRWERTAERSPPTARAGTSIPPPSTTNTRSAGDHRIGGAREPKRGTQKRTGDRPPERLSNQGQLLPTLPARRRVEPARPFATSHRATDHGQPDRPRSQRPRRSPRRTKSSHVV